jgi:hypothetical protein
MDIKVGQIILEISAITIKILKKLIFSVAGKLPMKSEFVFKKLNYDISKS